MADTEDSVITTTSSIPETRIMNTTVTPAPASISIKYIGNSFFYITFSDGTRLVTDPYGHSYEQYFGVVPELEADIITISHNHEDHTGGISGIGGAPLVIKPEQVGDTYNVGDVVIKSFSSDHVADMGENVIYLYEENGLKIVNMGETDLIASDEAVAAAKDADVILAYAGQYGSIKNKESFETLFGMNIRVLIPQHYSNIPGVIFYGEPEINDILKDVPEDVKVTEASEFLVTKDLDAQFVNLSAWVK